MRIALVHDYLREYGGAERVIEVMHEMWPDAPLFTSFIDWGSLGRHADRFRNWDIRTSWVQGNPIVKTLHSPLRFLAPKIWESFDFTGYDLVVSSSGWYMCRGVRVRKPTVHISYIHHPPRNLYGYATGSTLQKYGIVRAYAGIINFFLRHYDYETAQRVDFFVANSKETARRVWKFYRRESTVIYPPVELNKFKVQSSKFKVSDKKSYFLSVGRLTYSKRVDIAITAANKLKLPLKIVGTGPEEAHLRSLAGPTVEFLGAVSDEELATLYYYARALIFTALDEDFGMVPVEAMAHGTPVIALAQGGVVETVIDGETGMFFGKPETKDLIRVIKRFNSDKQDWESACRKQAEKFGKERFRRELAAFVQSKLRKI